jgi:hypothetical protein
MPGVCELSKKNVQCISKRQLRPQVSIGTGDIVIPQRTGIGSQPKFGRPDPLLIEKPELSERAL